MFIVGLRPCLSEDEYVKFRAGLNEAQIKIVANKKTIEDFHVERDFEKTCEGFGSRSSKERRPSFLSRRHSSLLCWGFLTFQEESCSCFWMYSRLVHGEDI